MLKREIRSFGYAGKGLKAALKDEKHMRFHLVAALLVIAAGICADLSMYEWVAVTICIGMVLMAELFNTAIENLTDFVSPAHHELAGKVKDIASAAVLVACISAAVAGLFIFIPHIF